MKPIAMLLFTCVFVVACQSKNIDSAGDDAQIQIPTNTTNEQTKEQTTIKPCSKEAKQCANGKIVSRNPHNNCAFDACDSSKLKKDSIMCPADVKECPDGTFVSRDHSKNCKFKDCPNSEQ